MKPKHNALGKPGAFHQCDHINQGNPAADVGQWLAYADGSSLGNPGPGGWACIIQSPDGARRQLSGPLENTTNNRAELLAAIHALLEIPRGAVGEVCLDSEYIVKGANEWRAGWESRGWKNAKGRGIANPDLFKALFDLLDALPGVRLGWVKGHAGDPLNELCDTLAKAQAVRAREGVQ